MVSVTVCRRSSGSSSGLIYRGQPPCRGSPPPSRCRTAVARGCRAGRRDPGRARHSFQPAGWLAGWLCGEVNSCPGSGSLGSRWQREPAPLDCTANHLAGSPSATTTTRRTAPPPPCPSSTPPTWPPPADDFYPSDKASHIPHIAACAYNGLFLSPLALPDWDMCVGLVDASSALCLLSLASHDHCPWEP